MEARDIRNRVVEERLDGLETRITNLEGELLRKSMDSLNRDVDMLTEQAIISGVLKRLSTECLGIPEEKLDQISEEVAKEMAQRVADKIRSKIIEDIARMQGL